MSNYLEKILALLTKKPDLRAIQISDQLDIDPEVVENTLAQAVKDGNLIAMPVLGPNTLKVNAYRVNPSVLGWVTIEERGRAKTEDKEDMADGQSKKLTKTDMAIAFLTGKKWVIADELAIAMQLGHEKCSPRPYLAKALRDGTVVKNGTWYCLADEAGLLLPNNQESAAAIEANQTDRIDAIQAAAQEPSLNTEFIDILRAKLTGDEFRGYLKGCVIEQVICADSQVGYDKAVKYARCLAEGFNAATPGVNHA
ncbi:hypothetical protein [Undibacterium sp. TJN19]|uniref:hypothetical protein n=1 Tax=Undibacterium sp. TJN19 TaxID=3413055 RepID=UPI003BF0527B